MGFSFSLVNGGNSTISVRVVMIENVSVYKILRLAIVHTKLCIRLLLSADTNIN